MAPKLHVEIGQVKPFVSIEAEAFLNLQRTSDFLMRGLERVLKPTNLTQTQYNVLRILRGAGRSGLLCRELGERMVTRDPDITRLLDRLEARGLVRRSRSQADRRAVRTRIRTAGLSLLEKLDHPVAELHKQQLQHLGSPRVRQLIDLLEAARERLA
jgi:DNA-binding MarR family transcriptional regulator